MTTEQSQITQNPQSVSQTLQDPQTPVHVETHRERQFDYSNILRAGKLLQKLIPKGDKTDEIRGQMMDELNRNFKQEHVLTTEANRVKHRLDTDPHMDRAQRSRLNAQLKVLNQSSLFAVEQDRLDIRTKYSKLLEPSEVTAAVTGLGGVPTGEEIELTAEQRKQAEELATLQTISTVTGLSMDKLMSHRRTVQVNAQLTAEDANALLSGDTDDQMQSATITRDAWGIAAINAKMVPILKQGGFKTDQEFQEFKNSLVMDYRQWAQDYKRMLRDPNLTGGSVQVNTWSMDGREDPLDVELPPNLAAFLDISTADSLYKNFTTGLQRESFLSMFESAPAFRETYMALPGATPDFVAEVYFGTVVPTAAEYATNKKGLRTRALQGRDPAATQAFMILDTKDKGASEIATGYNEFLRTGEIHTNPYIADIVASAINDGILKPNGGLTMDDEPTPALLNYPNAIDTLSRRNPYVAEVVLDPTLITRAYKNNPQLYTAFDNQANAIVTQNLEEVMAEIVEKGLVLERGDGTRKDFIGRNNPEGMNRPLRFIGVNDRSQLSYNATQALDRINTHLTAMHYMEPDASSSVIDEMFNVSTATVQKGESKSSAARAQKEISRYEFMLNDTTNHPLYETEEDKNIRISSYEDQLSYWQDKLDSAEKRGEAARQTVTKAVGEDVVLGSNLEIGDDRYVNGSAVVDINGKTLSIANGWVISENGESGGDFVPYRLRATQGE